MPPGQPVRRCAECGFLRPTRPFEGEWLCLECAPIEPVADQAAFATDGGER
jgi:hypothetical protein